ncbi:hypothetical protein P4U03_03490 [Bacillus mycoides]|jgi:rubrerythrin|uniref:Ferritin-like diiron domain-containing protein n=1 Tax=Bacillus mycoides TaxID=1405 RepID=A0A653PKQ6_BACMY|nr:MULTISPECIES: hypothetical protein [Bacillus cereus group]EJQ67231.1 hypothetical protein IG7_03867 [Bacillus cereus HuA2-4]MED1265745.1 hypothetical protein [Bacillus mycoides]QWJ05209.1 hypothetical protein J5V76_19960 [Bacillus mycoides]VXB30224.1 conserved hypothetical protein [Bacillus mycoides]
MYFYQTMTIHCIDETTNQQVKETFRRAAADEQNHAVWFLYYFSKQNKK